MPTSSCNSHGAVIGGDGQTMLGVLALLVGFAVVVMGLHAGELLWVGLRRRWRVVASCGGGALVMVLIVIVWQIASEIHVGLSLSAVLALFGAQSALVVCVPAHVALWWARRRAREDLRQQAYRSVYPVPGLGRPGRQ